jgi:hypothetical protein
MLPLKAKIIWEEKREDSENNELIVRAEKRQAISDKPTVPERTCVIKISSPCEDDCGEPIRKRLQFSIDAAALCDMREGIAALRLIKVNLTPKNGLVQVYHEGASGLVVMYEAPPFADPSQIQTRYVIGNGIDVRFIVGGLEDLDKLHTQLANAIRMT